MRASGLRVAEQLKVDRVAKGVQREQVQSLAMAAISDIDGVLDEPARAHEGRFVPGELRAQALGPVAHVGDVRRGEALGGGLLGRPPDELVGSVPAALSARLSREARLDEHARESPRAVVAGRARLTQPLDPVHDGLEALLPLATDVPEERPVGALLAVAHAVQHAAAPAEPTPEGRP